MDELARRLRRCTYTLGPSGRENPKPINPDGPEAADRIEKLEAENARLWEIVAAVPISEMVGRTVGQDKIRTYNEAKGMLLSALNNAEQTESRAPHHQ